MTGSSDVKGVKGFDKGTAHARARVLLPPRENPSPPSLLEAALRYAAAGWHVVPLYEPVEAASAEHPYGVCSCPRGPACGRDCGKHPRTARGSRNATTDPDQIRDWWTRWPNANIGVALPLPGVLLIDIDPLHGGDARWATLCAEHEPLRPTVCQRSGSGGFHGLYRIAPGTKLRGKLAPGIDLPTSYFVAAPSLHFSGERYSWVRAPWDHEIVKAPPWLVELARGGRALPSRARRGPGNTEEHAPARGSDPSVESWSKAVRVMRAGGTDADAASALRTMASYERRLRERGEQEAERWLALTIREARASRAASDPWGGSIIMSVVSADYRYSPEFGGKPELHRVRLRLQHPEGSLRWEYVTLPTPGYERARDCYEAVLGHFPLALWSEAHAAGDQRKLAGLTDGLVGMRVQIVPGTPRAKKMRRVPDVRECPPVERQTEEN